MWSRSVLRRAVDQAAATAWSWGFALARRRGARRWASPGRQRVLVVAPHPDDEVAGCAGVILLHRQARDAVTVVHATDGRQSRAGGLDPPTMAARRRDEAGEAATALGVRAEWLGLPEGGWADHDLQERLAALLDSVDPEVVYAPSRVDFHPEHLRVAAVLAQALASRQGPSRTAVRIYQVQVPLTRILVNLVAPVDGVADPSRHAMERYVSQLGSLARCDRLKRYAARRHGLPGLAEEFWEMPAETFIRLHRRLGEVPGLGPPFRGLRDLAVTDPLAFLRGGAERRRLRRLARSAVDPRA